jgi:hypothetical protein
MGSEEMSTGLTDSRQIAVAVSCERGKAPSGSCGGFSDQLHSSELN